jgi:hypothetical protein
MSTGGPTDKRPTIALNGTGTAATIFGFDSVSVSSVEMVHAAQGLFVNALTQVGLSNGC